MTKGKKKWLIALLAALAGVIPVLVPEAAPLAPVIERVFGPGSASHQEDAESRQCASNWSVCPPVPSPEAPSQQP